MYGKTDIIIICFLYFQKSSVNTSELYENRTMSDIEIIAQSTAVSQVEQLSEPAYVESDTELDEPMVKKVPTKVFIANDSDQEDDEVEQEDEEPEREEEQEEQEQDEEEDAKLLEQLDSQIEKAEKQIQSKAESSKPANVPKGKYDDMTFKELQALTKERNIAGRSVLKNRTLIILKLEELDAQPNPENSEDKTTNKYEAMTIPELKKLMVERNIAGRSAAKNKPSMIEKLLAFDENPEVATTKTAKKEPKEPKEKVAKPAKEEEDPLDEEVNKKVAELVNKLYKIKKHAKKQAPEFKNGFVDYINDLCTLVEDYRQSNNQ